MVSGAPSSAIPFLFLPLGCYWLLQRSTCFHFFSQYSVGPGKIRFIEMWSSNSPAPSSYVLSLTPTTLRKLITQQEIFEDIIWTFVLSKGILTDSQMIPEIHI
jgi:hypothetical protein